MKDSTFVRRTKMHGNGISVAIPKDTAEALAIRAKDMVEINIKKINQKKV